jgi:DNA-binding transcriptional MerR regulator
MYDRLTGSTTMVIVSGGTTVPGTPARPEYLKASVYLPPAFVSHNPDLHRDLIDIIQHYIETVGVRTVKMWAQKARKDLGYSLTQVGKPLQNQDVNGIPSPDYHSAHYTFLGQPYRKTADPSTSSFPPPSPTNSTDSYAFAFGDDPDDSAFEIIDLQQANSELREQVHNLQQRIRDLEEEVKITQLRNTSLTARTQDRIAYLEGKIQKYAETTLASTPVRNVNMRPTYPKTPPTPLKYGSVSPSRAPPTRSQILPGYSSSSKASSPPINTDRLAPSCGSLLPHYIKIYGLGHLSTLINLIGSNTPVETHKEELLKLRLDEGVCEALAEAMTLDKGLLNV